MRVNLDGKSQGDGDTPKPFLQEDSYPSVIQEISDIEEYKVWNEENKMEEKMRIKFRVKDGEDKQHELNMYPKPLVTKGSGTYSNSKMYDVLDKAGLLDEFKKVWEQISVLTDPKAKNAAFVDFLQKNLVNKPCKVMVKTVKKGTPEQYSIVKEVIRFGE